MLLIPISEGRRLLPGTGYQLPGLDHYRALYGPAGALRFVAACHDMASAC